MSITSKIRSLINSAETKTKKTFNDLTEAIQGLCDGYGDDNILLYAPQTLKLDDNRYVSTYGTNNRVGCVLASNSNPHNQIILNLSQVQTSARIIIKAKINNLFANNWMKMTGGNGANNDESKTMWIGTGYKSSEESLIYMGCPKSNGVSITAQATVPNGIWLYCTIYYDKVSQTAYYNIYDENLTVLFTIDLGQPSVYNNTSSAQFIGGNPSQTTKGDMEINLNETFLEIDNVLVWGKTNSKTENMGKPVS